MSKLNKNKFDSFYTHITDFAPYQYQVQVYELLLSGKNVILTVPTGAGKTWASVMPFLFARHTGNRSFPQKMIYSLPLRTLANSIHYDFNKTLKDKETFINISSIQTGEYKNDPHFEKDIIFSTIDQTLSSFLCFPLSLSKRQANINAGALIGSYLVFDEFHLLDPKLSMATTIGALRTLNNLCRFCIMTATLSEDYIEKLKSALDPKKQDNIAVVSIKDFPEDEAKIKSLIIPEGYTAKKAITVKDEKITAQTILKHHKIGSKTIVICNRVEKTQQLYNDITTSDLTGFHNLVGLEKSNVICIHGRFFDEDRKSKEKKIKQLFGNENHESAILISTQVIEAGMDISCETMHVEISPVNSFLQRAGRCARWEKQHGNIYVYDILELDEKEKLNLDTDDKEELAQIRAINNKYLPYDKKLCRATFEKLKSVSSLDKNISQELVNEILTSHELKYYTCIEQGDFNRKEIEESWKTCEKKMYSQTIRDIQNIEIAIIDCEQEKGSNFIPYKYQTISLYKWSFIKWAKEILNERDFDFDQDVIFIPIKNSESQFLDFDTNDLDKYSLKEVRTIEPLKNCYDIVFVDKSIFNYTAGAGLELGEGIACSPLKSLDNKEKEIIEYRKDTFWQHNKAIIGCYEQVFNPNNKLQFTFDQLNNYWGEEINWDKLIKAMICLHDYGKLNNEWQGKMKILQKLKAAQDSLYIFKENEVLAHSDFNDLTDKEIEKQSGAKSKPAHAGVGAYALVESAKEIIEAIKYEELANAVSTAILKHHGVDTLTYPAFIINSNDYKQMDILLSGIGIGAKLNQKARSGNLLDNLPINEEEWIIYLFLVRILRLSDQKATMNYKKYLNQ